MKLIEKIKAFFFRLFRKNAIQQTESTEPNMRLTPSQLARVKRYFKAKLREQKKMNARPREEFPCRVCLKPMLVGSGQAALYHSECRKFRHNAKLK